MKNGHTGPRRIYARLRDTAPLTKTSRLLLLSLGLYEDRRQIEFFLEVRLQTFLQFGLELLEGQLLSAQMPAIGSEMRPSGAISQLTIQVGLCGDRKLHHITRLKTIVCFLRAAPE